MKTIALGYHDVVEEPGFEPDPFRPCSAHYTMGRKKLREHLANIDNSRGKMSVAVIAAKRSWGNTVPIFLTFDDGGIGAYSCIADELESHNWRGHFLVTTDWIGKPGFLDGAQIRALHQRGHVIGSHTCSHPERMSSLTWTRLLREWSESRAVLSDIVGADVAVASVADGYYSRKVAESAAACGINVLFTSEPTTDTEEVAGCLVIGRYSILASSPPTLSVDLARRSVARWRQAAFWKIKKAAKAIAGPHYTTVRAAVLRIHHGSHGETRKQPLD